MEDVTPSKLERFDFARFRERVNSPTREGLCAWSESSISDGEDVGCKHAILEGDVKPLIKWLLQNPEAQTLPEIPLHLHVHAFCAIHVVRAVETCKLTEHSTSPKAGLTGPAVSNSREEASTGFQFTFTCVPELPSPFDLAEASNILGESDIQATVSKDRILSIFHNERDNKPMVVDHKLDLLARSHINATADESTKPLPLPDTPARSENHEGSSRSSAYSPKSRLSLEDKRRISRSQRYEREKSRSRTISPPHGEVDERVELAYATLSGDISFERSVFDHEKTVIDLLKEPLQYTNRKTMGQAGIVYAIRDPMLKLVKIGCTQGEDNARYARIRSECKLAHAVYIVRDPDMPKMRPLLAFEHLEKLVHADLKPHRWYFNCKCGLSFGDRQHFREHHEWYKIPDEVALKTIRLWQDFLEKDPYGTLQPGRNKLRDDWVRHLDERILHIEQRDPFTEDEGHYDHDKRLRRWQMVFRLQKDQALFKSSSKASSSNIFDIDRAAVPLDLPSILEPVPSIEAGEESVREIQPANTGDTADLLVHGHRDDSAAREQPQVSLPPGPSLGIESLPTMKVEPGKKFISTATNVHQSHDQPTARDREHIHNLESEPAHTQGFNQDRNKSTDRVSIVNSSDKKFNDIIADVSKALMRKREGLRERTILSDLIHFRWPLACAFVIAALAPYAPAGLAFSTWSLFLPFLLAELREW